MNANGLCLVLSILALYTDQVWVCILIKACAHSQHMLIGLVQGLQQLWGKENLFQIHRLFNLGYLTLSIDK